MVVAFIEQAGEHYQQSLSDALNLLINTVQQIVENIIRKSKDCFMITVQLLQFYWCNKCAVLKS
jgi:hypothetical protein